MHRPLPTVRSLTGPDHQDLSHQRRVEAIRRLQLLERAGDPQLDAIARLARHVTGAGSAAIHVLDDRWQHRIAGAGDVPDSPSHPIEDTLCTLVVEDGEATVCADASVEERFAYSSFTCGEDPVRFYASLPLRVADGPVIGTVCTFDHKQIELSDEQLGLLQDVAAQAAAYLELLRVATELGELAVLDPLTGAVNQVVFHERLSETLARRTAGAHVAVAVFDVDHFKALNDTHGHAAGDFVLQALVEHVRSAIGAAGVIGRLGGDEFGLILETTDPTPHQLRRALAQALRAAEWPPQLRPRVTIGAVYAWPNEDARAVMHRADEAMYLRKRRRGAIRGLAA